MPIRPYPKPLYLRPLGIVLNLRLALRESKPLITWSRKEKKRKEAWIIVLQEMKLTSCRSETLFLSYRFDYKRRGEKAWDTQKLNSILNFVSILLLLLFDFLSRIYFFLKGINLTSFQKLRLLPSQYTNLIWSLWYSKFRVQ